MTEAAPNTDVVLQVGATFETAPPESRHPILVLCDSNIRMAQDTSALPYTEAGALGAKLLRAVEAREAKIYRDSAGVLTLSERARRSFLDDFRLPADRVTAIYAGPNVEMTAPPLTGRSASPRILFVGRQFERKGGDCLLAAFRRVREQVPNAQLWIVGPDPRDHEPGVRWLGFLNQRTPSGREILREAFLTAAVYCLPTRFEPLGISFIEAMHLGLPCVGTDVWAVPEMIVDGETGFTVPVNDVESLAERLVRLLRNPDLAAQMGKAGQARAQAIFTWDRAAGRLLEVAQRVARS